MGLVIVKNLLKMFSFLICFMVMNFLLFPNIAGAVFDNKKNSETLQKNDDNYKFQEVLAVLKTPLNINDSKKDDIFTAKIMESLLISNNKVLIPADSILAGSIAMVKKPGFIFKDAFIKISIDTIIIDSDKTIVLTPPFETNIYSPEHKGVKKKFLSKLPSSIASSGSSFILGQATSMGRGAVWGISTAAGIFGGIFSGLTMPDKNKTSIKTCADRAFDSTPPGTFTSIISKGKSFKLDSGEYINIHFDKNAVKHISKELYRFQ